MLCRNVLLTIKEDLRAEVALPVQGDLSFTLQIVFGSGYTVGARSENRPCGEKEVSCPSPGPRNTWSNFELELRTLLNLERRKTFKLGDALHSPHLIQGMVLLYKSSLHECHQLAVLQNVCQTDRYVQEYLCPQEHPHDGTRRAEIGQIHRY